MPEPESDSERTAPRASTSAPADNPVPRNATLLEVAGAVFSSFLGIRKGKAMRKDAVTIRPHQVIAVAVVLVAIFVVALFFFVRTIVRSAGL
jgi:hypothetical protein